jgi:hypothetical protein
MDFEPTFAINMLVDTETIGDEAIHAICHAIWRVDPAILIALNFFAISEGKLSKIFDRLKPGAPKKTTKSSEGLTAKDLTIPPYKDNVASTKLRAFLRKLILNEIKNMSKMIRDLPEGQLPEQLSEEALFDQVQNVANMQMFWVDWFMKNKTEENSCEHFLNYADKKTAKTIRLDDFHLKILICRVFPRFQLRLDLAIYTPIKDKPEYLEILTKNITECDCKLNPVMPLYWAQSIAIAINIKGKYKAVLPTCEIDYNRTMQFTRTYFTPQQREIISLEHLSQEPDVPAPIPIGKLKGKKLSVPKQGLILNSGIIIHPPPPRPATKFISSVPNAVVTKSPLGGISSSNDVIHLSPGKTTLSTVSTTTVSVDLNLDDITYTQLGVVQEEIDKQLATNTILTKIPKRARTNPEESDEDSIATGASKTSKGQVQSKRRPRC